MSGRRVCESCGSSYHLENKRPQQEGICDKCQGTLIQREDDQPNTVKNRLKIYHEQTKPLEDYYKSQGKLTVIQGDEKTIEETIDLVQKALEA
jgi:adenylate kinase